MLVWMGERSMLDWAVFWEKAKPIPLAVIYEVCVWATTPKAIEDTFRLLCYSTSSIRASSNCLCAVWQVLRASLRTQDSQHSTGIAVGLCHLCTDVPRYYVPTLTLGLLSAVFKSEQSCRVKRYTCISSQYARLCFARSPTACPASPVVFY